MGILILFIIILITALFLSLITKKQLDQTIFLSLIIVLLVLYVFGLFNALRFSIIVIVFISILLLISDIYIMCKHSCFIRQYLLKPITLFYIFLFFFTLIYFKNSFLHDWDEFSHWALYPKNMYIYDKFLGSEFTSSNNGYPPIVSILQYFVAKLENSFTEANLYRSSFVFSTLSLTPILSYSSFKKPFHLLLTCLAIICLPFCVFTDYYSSICVDVLLATLFATLIIKLVFEDISLFNWIYMFLISSVLVLVKEFGLVLVAIFYCLVLFDILLLRKEEYFKCYENIKTMFVKKLIWYTSFLIPFITKATWLIYLNSKSSLRSSQISSLKILYPSYGNKVILKFVYNILVKIFKIGSIYSTIALYFITFVVILVIGSLLLKQKRDSKKIKIIIICFIIIFGIYCFALLLSYLWLFSEYEALYLASFIRYIKTILLSIMLITIFSILIYYYENKFKNSIILLIVFLLVVCIYPYEDLIEGVRNVVSDNNKKAMACGHATADEIVNDIGINSKVYYICQESHGFDYFYNKYYLTPIHIQNNEWWISSENSSDNHWIFIKSKDDWEKELIEYDYLYIDDCNEDFINNYSMLFVDMNNISNDSLYTIEINNGNVSLSLKKCYGN